MTDVQRVEETLVAAEMEATRTLTEVQRLQRQLTGGHAEYRRYVKKFTARGYAAWRATLVERLDAARASYTAQKAQVKELRRQAFDARVAAQRTERYAVTPPDVALIDEAARLLHGAHLGTSLALSRLAALLRGDSPASYQANMLTEARLQTPRAVTRTRA